MSGARRLYPPRPAAVRTDEAGVPCSLGSLAVESIREDWIVGPIGWYTGRSVRRRYYQLILSNGRCITVFRDLYGGRWYRH